MVQIIHNTPECTVGATHELQRVISGHDIHRLEIYNGVYAPANLAVFQEVLNPLV